MTISNTDSIGRILDLLYMKNTALEVHSIKMYWLRTQLEMIAWDRENEDVGIICSDIKGTFYLHGLITLQGKPRELHILPSCFKANRNRDVSERYLDD